MSAGPRRVQADVLDRDLASPGSAAAATIQNAADEKSPGTGSDWPVPR